MRRVGTLLVCSMLAASAAAEPLRLEYPMPSVKGCPSFEALQRSVHQRLGRDPWDANASRSIRVRIRRTGTTLRASVEVENAEGVVVGKRVLTSHRGDCQELGESMALAIAIAIDPLYFDRVQTLTSRPASRPVTPPPVTPPPGPRISVSAGIGGSLALGVAPGPTGGLGVQLGVRWRFLAVAAEGRVVFPASTEVEGGRISTWLAGGAVLPCGSYRRFVGCGVLSVAALVAEGHGLVNAQRVTKPYLAVGLRLAGRIVTVGRFSMCLWGELMAPLVRVALENTQGQAYWTTPPVAGNLGVDVQAILW